MSMQSQRDVLKLVTTVRRAACAPAHAPHRQKSAPPAVSPREAADEESLPALGSLEQKLMLRQTSSGKRRGEVDALQAVMRGHAARRWLAVRAPPTSEPPSMHACSCSTCCLTIGWDAPAGA